MTFDYVHHTQQAYRRLIDCSARPGSISSLQDICAEMDLSIKCRKSTLLLMLMLLDTEVTFNILGRDSEHLTKYVSQLTYSHSVPVEEADFIILLQDRSDHQLAEVLLQCKLGNLLNPHQSATLIVEVDKIANERQLILSGPGIESANYVSVTQAGTGWIEARAAKNIEYPLGIELYFLSLEDKIMALSRTTLIDHLAMETEVKSYGLCSR